MRAPGLLKQEFLRKWITSLQICSATKNTMSILERKDVIKLSADLAMASTKNSMTRWSKALIANAWMDGGKRIYLEHALGAHKEPDRMLMKNSTTKRVRSKKILKRSCGSKRRKKMAGTSKMNLAASSIAKRLVKKKTQVLKRLIPGGERLDDEQSLIRETLDYILSLRVQVDVMRRLVNATENFNCINKGH